jgi:hypothetical protein
LLQIIPHCSALFRIISSYLQYVADDEWPLLQVAVKVLLPKPSLQARVQREFVLEQEIWSQMDHPGIVRVIYAQKEPLDQRVIVSIHPVNASLCTHLHYCEYPSSKRTNPDPH